jgi:parvulin-like peptidyl-prolyl isomerase
MPPDFFAAVAGAQRGQVIGPIQTSLGFHIVEITDVKPPETLGYDGARAEIESAMIDRERLARVGNLVNDLGRSVAVRRR